MSIDWSKMKTAAALAPVMVVVETPQYVWA